MANHQSPITFPMTFLPIVERELRVAARRPGTYWTRWFAALAMMAVWVLLAAAIRKSSSAELGKTLFVALGVLALGFCLLAGIFLTADCLSEEKRAGTLGLLFLTDLRGYDVVLGKLIATSVHSVYGLLAMFPVLALPLMMGGVTVGEFWRVVAALAVTLFLSLSMGMCVSAAVREARQATAGTFLGMLLLAGGPPAFWSLGGLLFATRPPGALLWPSPVNAFVTALDSHYRLADGPREFWCSLLMVSGLGMGLLVWAAYLLPRVWQEKAGSAPADGETLKAREAGLAYLGRRVARSRHFLEVNPYLWLAGGTRSSDILGAVLFGLLFLFWFCCLAVSIVADPRRPSTEAFVLCLFTAYGLHQVGKYLMAVEATRQLGEDRRSGALELLLVTPLGETQILSGQKQAVRRHSQGLKMALLLVNVCMCLVVLARPKQLHINPTDQALFVELFAGGVLALFLDFRALPTVGMWMALRARRHQRAVLGTLGRVMLVSWAGIFLWVFLMTTRAFAPGESELAMIFALWFTAGIINDLVFGALARVGLGRGLRYWMSGAKPAGDWERFRAAELSPAMALNT